MGSSWCAGLLAVTLLLGTSGCVPGSDGEFGVVEEAGTVEDLCEGIEHMRLGRQKGVRINAHAPDDVVGLGDSWRELYAGALRQAPPGHVEDAQAVLDYLLETAHLRAGLEVINTYRGPNPDIEQATADLAAARAGIPGLREASGRIVDACQQIGVEPTSDILYLFPPDSSS
jgi:hypothetical protein